MDKVELLKKRIRNEGKINESAIKRPSSSGKDKSLLRMACQLGYICNRAPIERNGRRYVNPHTYGDRIFLEGINPIEYVEYKDNEFYDKDKRLISIYK